MLAIPVIPFLLGSVITPDFSDEDSIVLNPVYTFYVRIDTSYNGVGRFYRVKLNVAVVFNLTCTLRIQQSLKCYIDKDSIRRLRDTYVRGVQHMVFTPSRLAYSQNQFRIMFDRKGVKDYLIEDENVANKSSLLEMYRMIGDQLSVGTNIRYEQFYAIERSSIGKCLTRYQISLDENFSPNYYKLQSLLQPIKIGSPKLEFDKYEELRIEKQRVVENCTQLSNYFLGQKLWSYFDFSPKLTVKTAGSKSMMSLATHEFYSNSVNEFYIYQQKNQRIGVIKEKIAVTLESVKL